RHADELAVVAVDPAVVDTHEAACITLPLGAHDSAAMAAGVEQAVHLAGLVAAEDHRPAGDPPRAEVAGIFQLGSVADINPAAAEDRRHLLAQNVVGDEHFAVEQEGLSLAVVDDVGAGGHLKLSLAAPEASRRKV